MSRFRERLRGLRNSNKAWKLGQSLTSTLFSGDVIFCNETIAMLSLNRNRPPDDSASDDAVVMI
jgi:hypothetical protein